jgi:hypothetical protein
MLDMSSKCARSTVAIRNTIRLMAEVDEAIPNWPME